MAFGGNGRDQIAAGVPSGGSLLRPEIRDWCRWRSDLIVLLGAAIMVEARPGRTANLEEAHGVRRRGIRGHVARRDRGTGAVSNRA